MVRLRFRNSDLAMPLAVSLALVPNDHQREARIIVKCLVHARYDSRVVWFDRITTNDGMVCLDPGWYWFLHEEIPVRDTMSASCFHAGSLQRNGRQTARAVALQLPDRIRA
jgi:hypothetical protein